jgi:hypothetical protein
MDWQAFGLLQPRNPIAYNLLGLAISLIKML